MTRSLLGTLGAPHNLWVEAVLTSVYLFNLLPTPTLNWDTPHNRLYGSPHSYSSLRVFGCSCYPHLGSYISNKLSSRSVECVFLGYSSQHKGYRCVDSTTGCVYISRHVIFNETIFPNKQLYAHSVPDAGTLEFTLLSSPGLHLPQPAPFDPSPSIENDNTICPPDQSHSISQIEPQLGVDFLAILTSLMPTAAPIITYQRHRSINPESSQLATTSLQPTALDAMQSQQVSSVSLAVTEPSVEPTPSVAASQSIPAMPAPPPSPPRRTRLQHGIVQTKIHNDGTIKYPIPCALLTIIEAVEPICYTQASKHEVWHAAMVDEINALLKNNTWTLVPPSSSQNIVGCKKVFRVKHNPMALLNVKKRDLWLKITPTTRY